ncbi:MAG: hypothetical protein IKB10_04250 [Alphaproteobacteria bacterium]|nr:hypothetical protein [Alphaproteobacteria bacterium]
MQKILKLSTVSILTIMAASNANAAGYTCEELIEYTSCNAGYYLNAGDCIEGTTCGAGNYLKATCPEGSVYDSNWCWVSDSPGDFVTDGEYCEESGGDLLGPGCISQEILDYISEGDYSWYYPEDDENWSLTDVITPALSYTCSACAAGEYQPSAGQYSCLTCPAGSECPTTTTATLCKAGEYASAGSIACTTCPQHSYTNASGEFVTVSATSKAGAGSATACYIDPDTYFTDESGVYHFKSNCSYSTNASVPSVQLFYPASEDTVCDEGYELSDDYEGVTGNEYACFWTPKTEAECFAAAIIGDTDYQTTEWDGESCTCNGLSGWDSDGIRIYCQEI